MARHLACGLCFAVLAAVLVLQGCGKSSPVSLDRPVQPRTTHVALADPPASARGQPRLETSERSSASSASSLEQSGAEDPPPWLAELLHAPDPNVRVQELDAWARQPGVSLNPVTYALVDPDESVRVRAQEVLEQELARL